MLVSNPAEQEHHDEKAPAQEADLVALARTGDPDAFGELVRRSRAKAFNLAYSLTQDHHLAEDVVQEALVRAFLHLGSLVDSSRFAPWLKTIVRNEANMKLRRGGPHRRERPFTSWSSKEFASVEGARVGCDEPYNIDQVLFRLGKLALDEAKQAHDPSAALMRKDLVDGIRGMMSCLTSREKRIFEAYFFDQLSPQHIASLMDTAVANVYNSISRSRQKLQQERIRSQISLYIEGRKKLGKPAAKLLAPPQYKITWRD
ncbi:RNA polymerase sigma factor [Paenibacillus lignilyticus]|uniref:RNA polymerase sigma factor n=1 Tax=Paenibacillus lignilyticus TaxID=1172615 RepID=A0ABS5CD54_9BACL|nr:sigma-70 family RNA polymerase sigma factor [Paenibacillus lignilyticus]MBP3963917.1 sigma-70 family RNA polymerase sigma factor [Paenibacillus lignilyticus]